MITTCEKCNEREAQEGSNFCRTCGGNWNPPYRGQEHWEDGL